MSADGRSLLVVDDNAIRAAHFSSIGKILHKMDRIERDLDLFRSRDQPEFNTWAALTFRREKEELERLDEEQMQLERFHNWIILLSKGEQDRMPQAYRILTEEEKDYQRGNAQIRARIDHERRRRDEQVLASINKDQDEEEGFGGIPEQELREDLLDSEQAETAPGAQKHASDAFTSGFVGGPQNNRAKPLGTEEERGFKAIYRKLIRLLHPDRDYGLPVAAWKTRIWDRVLSAYQNRDVAVLQRLYVFSLLRSGLLSALTVGEIRQSQDWVARELVQMQGDVKALKKNPCFGFSRKRNLDSIFRKIKKEHDRAKQSVLEQMWKLRNFHVFLGNLSEIEASPGRSRRFRKPNRSDRQESLFDDAVI